MTRTDLTTRTPTTPAPSALPTRAGDVELLGRYEGSGFKEPPYLVRRGDGQMIQLPKLLYLVLEQATGEQSYEQIGVAVGEAIDRRIGPDDVQFLVDEKLRPLGVLNAEDGDAPAPRPKADPMLALKVKTALVPAELVRVLAAIFSPLFFPPVILAVLIAAIGLDYWLFVEHGVAQSIKEALYQPGTLLLILGLVVVSAVFHEIGHAAATRYGGARPGAMGAGLYLVWPAFYTDLTDAYTLGRGGRLRADLGGVYFNTIFMLGTAGAYFMTGFEPLLLMIPVQHLEIVHQLLPLLRLDGYYIVSDLTGVPDILSRIKPTLRSLVPGLKTDPRVSELRAWARAVVTAYVLLVIPVLIALFSLMAFTAPRIFATAWDAFGVTWERAQGAVDARQAIPSLTSLVQLVLLALTPVGVALTLVSAGKRISYGVWRSTETRPRARAVLVAVTSATATALFLNWWMNGAYEPIAAAERGTLSARAFDIRHGIGRGDDTPATSPRRQPETTRHAPVLQRSRNTDGLRTPAQTSPTTARPERTRTSRDAGTTEPSSGSDWTTPDATNDTASPTQTDTTPPTTSTPDTTETPVTTTTATPIP